MSGNKIPKTTQTQVRQRSQGLCEYCHASEQWQYVCFTVDHVIPLTKGGSDHFIWSADGLLIMGLTPTGRATVERVVLNRERVVNIRAADREVGRHPPHDDPIQQ